MRLYILDLILKKKIFYIFYDNFSIVKKNKKKI